jgi:hypothetical protein
MTTASLAKITTSASFPEHYMLENLAVRRRVRTRRRIAAKASLVRACLQ